MMVHIVFNGTSRFPYKVLLLSFNSNITIWSKTAYPSTSRKFTTGFQWGCAPSFVNHRMFFRPFLSINFYCLSLFDIWLLNTSPPSPPKKTPTTCKANKHSPNDHVWEAQLIKGNYLHYVRNIIVGGIMFNHVISFVYI